MAVRTARDLASYCQRVDHDGFAIVNGVVSPVQVAELRSAILQIPAGEEVRRRRNVYGIRNLLALSPACRMLAASATIRALVTPILGDQCFAVRGTFFDKVPGANWNLRWHQDSAIAVKQRIEAAGFHAWSTKAGVMQVRPPVEVLQNMLAVRVHLDDCLTSNGALRILAGSHRRRWEPEAIAQAKLDCEVAACEVREGDVLAMRPLALHASSASESPQHRRVIHIEFASAELPHGLEWQTRVGPD